MPVCYHLGCSLLTRRPRLCARIVQWACAVSIFRAAPLNQSEWAGDGGSTDEWSDTWWELRSPGNVRISQVGRLFVLFFRHMCRLLHLLFASKYDTKYKNVCVLVYDFRPVEGGSVDRTILRTTPPPHHPPFHDLPPALFSSSTRRGLFPSGNARPSIIFISLPSHPRRRCRVGAALRRDMPSLKPVAKKRTGTSDSPGPRQESGAGVDSGKMSRSGRLRRLRWRKGGNPRCDSTTRLSCC